MCAGGSPERKSCKTLHVSFSHGSKEYFLALNNLSAYVESRKFWDGRGGRTPPGHVSHSVPWLDNAVIFA